MKLWVRSQDKTQLLNAVGFYYDYQEEKHHITCLTKDHDYYWIGIYNSKERALEVLDEIQERIINLQLVNLEEKGKARSDVYKKEYLRCVYIMPKD